jgi:hypothetical protein
MVNQEADARPRLWVVLATFPRRHYPDRVQRVFLSPTYGRAPLVHFADLIMAIVRLKLHKYVVASRRLDLNCGPSALLPISFSSGASRDPGAHKKTSSPVSCDLALNEAQDVRVNHIRMSCRHAVWESLVHLERGMVDQLGGKAESAMGTIWSSSPCWIRTGTSIFFKSSLKSVSEKALMQS